MFKAASVTLNISLLGCNYSTEENHHWIFETATDLLFEKKLAFFQAGREQTLNVR